MTTFAGTGADQSYTVPAGVYAVQVVVNGAPGGNGWNYNALGAAGGNGGSVSAVIPVTPGEVLDVRVGVQGAINSGTTVAPSAYPGGGQGGYDSNYDVAGGNGGGYSGIFSGTTPLIVAGGGGGGGGSGGGTTYGGAGGAGGNPGGNGANGTSGGTGGSGGPGATQTTGNASLLGGNGGSNSNGNGDGGGGGGGYYGGEGGGTGGGSGSTATGGGGGGGGSSYAYASATSVSYTAGPGNGSNGSITITPIVPLAPTLTSPANASYGDLQNDASVYPFDWGYNTGGNGPETGYIFHQKVSGASSYNFWNASTNAFQSTSVSNTSTATSITFPNGVWTDNTTYNWSVASIDAGGTGPFASDFTVNAQAAPSVSVTAPTGTYSGSQTPTVEWADTLASGGTQANYRVVTYPSSVYNESGFVAGTTTGWVDDSGTVASAVTSYVVATPLPNNVTYRSYVIITQAPGSQTGTGYTTFTVALDTPAQPNDSATSGTDPTTGCPRIGITVNGHDNLLSANDASFEGGIGTWVVGTNCTIAQSAAEALDGSYSLALTSVAAGNMAAQTAAGTSGYAVTPGTSYTAIGSLRSAVSPRGVQVGIVWYTSSGGQISYAYGPATGDNTAGWEEVTYTAIAPSNAAFAAVTVQVLGTGGASEVHYLDCVGLFATSVPSESQWAGINPNLLSSGDFELGTEGWGSNNGATISQSSTYAFTGLNSLESVVAAQLYSGASLPLGSALVAGLTYTFSAWMYQPALVSGGGIQVIVSNGQLVFGNAVTTVGSWVRSSVTFVAGSSNELFITSVGTPTAGQIFYVDAVKLELGSVATQFVPPQYSNLDSSDPSFESSEGVPFVGLYNFGSMVVSRTTTDAFVGAACLSVFAPASNGLQLDPSAIGAVVGQTYTLSFYMKSISGGTAFSVNGNGQGNSTVNITSSWARYAVTFVANGQYLFMTANSDATFHLDAIQLDIGNQANPYVDGSEVGGSWDAANAIYSTSFEDGGTDGWTTVNGSSIANSTAEAYNGTHSLAVTSGAATSLEYAAYAPVVASVVGTTYTGSMWVYSADALQVRYQDAHDGTITGATVTLTANTWTRLVCTYTATGISHSPALDVAFTAAGQVVYIDAVQCEQREYATAYGQTATPNASSSTYNYPWSRGGLVGSTTAAILRSDGLYVRGASAANPVAIPAQSQTVTVYDYEIVPGVAYTYTAVVSAVLGANATVSSSPSTATGPITITTTKWWELDPTNVSSAINAQFISWQPEQVEQSTPHTVLLQQTANIVASAMMLPGFTGQAETFDPTTAAAFEALLASQKTLFVSSPWGVADSGYFRIGPTPEGMSTGVGLKVKSTQLLPSTASAPHRLISIQAVPQPRPPV